MGTCSARSLGDGGPRSLRRLGLSRSSPCRRAMGFSCLAKQKGFGPVELNWERLGHHWWLLQFSGGFPMDCPLSQACRMCPLPSAFSCSAGAGRTGTFCALSTVLERVKAEGILDVFQTVKSLRLQRPHMVQTLVRAPCSSCHPRAPQEQAGDSTWSTQPQLEGFISPSKSEGWRGVRGYLPILLLGCLEEWTLAG